MAAAGASAAEDGGGVVSVHRKKQRRGSTASTVCLSDSSSSSTSSCHVEDIKSSTHTLPQKDGSTDNKRNSSNNRKSASRSKCSSSGDNSSSSGSCRDSSNSSSSSSGSSTSNNSSSSSNSGGNNSSSSDSSRDSDNSSSRGSTSSNRRSSNSSGNRGGNNSSSTGSSGRRISSSSSRSTSSGSSSSRNSSSVGSSNCSSKGVVCSSSSSNSRGGDNSSIVNTLHICRRGAESHNESINRHEQVSKRRIDDDQEDIYRSDGTLNRGNSHADSSINEEPLRSTTGSGRGGSTSSKSINSSSGEEEGINSRGETFNSSSGFEAINSSSSGVEEKGTNSSGETINSTSGGEAINCSSSSGGGEEEEEGINSSIESINSSSGRDAMNSSGEAVNSSGGAINSNDDSINSTGEEAMNSSGEEGIHSSDRFSTINSKTNDVVADNGSEPRHDSDRRQNHLEAINTNAEYHRNSHSHAALIKHKSTSPQGMKKKNKSGQNATTTLHCRRLVVPETSEGDQSNTTTTNTNNNSNRSRSYQRLNSSSTGVSSIHRGSDHNTSTSSSNRDRLRRRRLLLCDNSDDQVSSTTSVPPTMVNSSSTGVFPAPYNPGESPATTTSSSGKQSSMYSTGPAHGTLRTSHEAEEQEVEKEGKEEEGSDVEVVAVAVPAQRWAAYLKEEEQERLLLQQQEQEEGGAEGGEEGNKGSLEEASLLSSSSTYPSNSSPYKGAVAKEYHNKQMSEKKNIRSFPYYDTRRPSATVQKVIHRRGSRASGGSSSSGSSSSGTAASKELAAAEEHAAAKLVAGEGVWQTPEKAITAKEMMTSSRKTLTDDGVTVTENASSAPQQLLLPPGKIIGAAASPALLPKPRETTAAPIAAPPPAAAEAATAPPAAIATAVAAATPATATAPGAPAATAATAPAAATAPGAPAAIATAVAAATSATATATALRPPGAPAATAPAAATAPGAPAATETAATGSTSAAAAAATPPAPATSSSSSTAASAPVHRRIDLFGSPDGGDADLSLSRLHDDRSSRVAVIPAAAKADEHHINNSNRERNIRSEKDCSELVLHTLLVLAAKYEQQGEVRRAHGFRVAAAAFRRLRYGSCSNISHSTSSSNSSSSSNSGSSSSSSRSSGNSSRRRGVKGEAAISSSSIIDGAAAVLHREGLTRGNYILLSNQPGIGKKIFQTIEEVIMTGSTSRMHALSVGSRASALEQLQRVWGVGYYTAERLLARGICSVKELRQRLEPYDKGVGVYSEASQALLLSRPQRLGLKYVEAFEQRIPRGEVAAVALYLRKLLLSPSSSSSSSSFSFSSSSSTQQHPQQQQQQDEEHHQQQEQQMKKHMEEGETTLLLLSPSSSSVLLPPHVDKNRNNDYDYYYEEERKKKKKIKKELTVGDNDASSLFVYVAPDIKRQQQLLHEEAQHYMQQIIPTYIKHKQQQGDRLFKSLLLTKNQQISLFKKQINNNEETPFIDLLVCGSYRRGKQDCGDIDILLLTKEEASTGKSLLQQVVKRLTVAGLLVDNLLIGDGPAVGGGGVSEENEEAEVVDTRGAPRALSPLHAAKKRRRDGSRAETETKTAAVQDELLKARLSARKRAGIELYCGACVWPPRPPSGDLTLAATAKSEAAGDKTEEAVLFQDNQSGKKSNETSHVTFVGPLLARRIDIKIYPARCAAFALLYFTGSAEYNRGMRLWAKRCGYSLDDTGLYPVTSFPVLKSTDRPIKSDFPANTAVTSSSPVATAADSAGEIKSTTAGFLTAEAGARSPASCVTPVDRNTRGDDNHSGHRSHQCWSTSDAGTDNNSSDSHSHTDISHSRNSSNNGRKSGVLTSSRTVAPFTRVDSEADHIERNTRSGSSPSRARSSPTLPLDETVYRRLSSKSSERKKRSNGGGASRVLWKDMQSGVRCNTEVDIFHALGLEYVPPAERDVFVEPQELTIF